VYHGRIHSPGNLNYRSHAHRSELLEAALKSIAAQSYEDFETIIVDDGSDELHAARQPTILNSLDKRFVMISPRGSPPTTVRLRCLDGAQAKPGGSEAPMLENPGDHQCFTDYDGA
jgi:hypothetical protein